MGLISRQYNYVAGKTIKASEVNANENRLYTAINGGLDETNLSATTAIPLSKLADEANPRVFLYDAFGGTEYVASGCLVSSDNTNVTVSSGVVFVKSGTNLYRINHTTSSVAVSSGTKYICIDTSGVLSAQADSNQSDKLILCKATAGTPITTVDWARRMPVLGQENQIDGLELTSESGTNNIHIEVGSCWIAGIKYLLPERESSFDLDTDANYIGSENAPTSSSWIYVYVTPNTTNTQTLDVKLSATAPAYFDAYGNQRSNGVNRYHYASSTPYRCIGAVYGTASSSSIDGHREFYQQGNYIQYPDPVVTINITATTTTQVVTANIPAISVLANFYYHVESLKGNSHYGFGVRKNGSSDTYLRSKSSPFNGGAYGINENTTISCFTDSSQQVQVTNYLSIGSEERALLETIGYWINIRD